MVENLISADNFLACAICLALANEAVSCGKCANVMCDSCYKQLKKQECPSCRQTNPVIQVNALARRMLGSLPTVCPQCQFKTQMGNLPDHLKKCEMRPFECCIEKCGYLGVEKSFIQHIIEVHPKELASMFDKNKETQIPTSNSFANQNYDRIATKQSQNGRQARLGKNGMYFCGGRLGFFCGCCNGNCGPDNGCCCVECMKLTLITRQLPKGYLVNESGLTIRKGTTGQFYCGCKLNLPGTDGWCGPTNGNNCQSCKRADQKQGFYSSLL